jgi:hypothetical protein
MKKLILVLGLGIAMSSCTQMVIVESLEDGQTMRLLDAYDISKEGDTLVVEQSDVARRVYGKFNGQIPKNTISLSKKVITYKLVKRVR